MERFKKIAGWTFIVGYALFLVFYGGALMVAAVQEAWPDEFAAHEIVTFGMWMGMGLLVLLVASMVPYLVYSSIQHQKKFDEIEEDADDLEGEGPVVEYETEKAREENSEEDIEW